MRKQRPRFLSRSLRAGLIISLAAMAALGLALSGGKSASGIIDRTSKIDGRRKSLPPPVTSGAQESKEIAPSALVQIQALLEEKQSRTGAQQKIDSQLLYAIKMRRSENIAAGVQTLAVDVGADDAGVVTVDISAIVDEQLLKDLADLGIEVTGSFPQYHALRAVAALDQLETIAGFPQVRFIQPEQQAMYSQA